jgi:23S rRNA pseudouridine1911/1915/1917 synthase
VADLQPADSAIVIGALLLAFASLDGSDERARPRGPRAPAAPGRHRRRDRDASRRTGPPRTPWWPRAWGSPGPTRQRAIAAGAVTVDGEPRSKSHRLAGGERVEVDASGSAELPPEGPPLEIAWRDEHLLVVRKPAGIPTHPTENRRSGTVVNRLLGMGVPLSRAPGPLRPGIVHRLDAGTSGLLVVACDDPTYEALAAMFKRHEADRRYLALVRGVVANDRFEVDAPLGRSGARVRVDATGGRSAATAFEARERFGRATLLEARPRTGRTHQIRVHLSAVGHPVLGDRRYGGGRAGRARARTGPAVPARLADRVRAPVHGRAPRPGGSAAAGPTGGAGAGREAGPTRLS